MEQKIITPNDLRNIGNTTEKHEHKWAIYDGCLGYESLICELCGIDINDIKIADRVREVVEGLNISEIERLRQDGFTNDAFFNQDGTLTNEYKWIVKEKAKYFYLNCGGSGAFMVDKETGEIYNIKAYGQIDKNKKIKADLGNIKTCNSEILHSKRWNYLR